MDNLLDAYEDLKISALRKSKLINSFVTDTTIGPNKTFFQADDNAEDKQAQTNTQQHVLEIHSHNFTSPSPVNLLLVEYEAQRQKEVQQALHSRVNQISEFSRKQTSTFQEKQNQRKLLLLQKEREKEETILKSLEEYDKDTAVREKQLAQRHQLLAEKRKQNALQLEEFEKKKQMMVEVIEKLNKFQGDFCLVYQKIVSDINGFLPHFPQCRDRLSDILPQLKHLHSRMTEILGRCKTKTYDENDCQKFEKLIQDIKGLQNIVEDRLNTISKELQTASQAPTPPPAYTPPVIPQQSQQLQAEEELVKKESISNITTKYASNDSFSYYSELQNFANNYKQSYSNFVQDINAKKLRFSLQKAINIPVNAISAANQIHLLDKYNKLTGLLSGQHVEVGDTTVCVRDHPEGLLFCTALLAKKFVLQGDLIISSNPESAFHYAAVAISIWNDYPNFGKLLVAEFHTQCPYLVPIYFPRTVGETDQEFYSKLGYQFKDNVIEKQDKFLKRVTGIMRLYSAMIITRPKRGQKQNPLGYIEGWRWLSAFLNLEPKPDISATLLHVFLENCGFLLQKIYGTVFRKLVIFIYQYYLVAIEKIDNGGPVSRLKNILEDYKRNGEFDKPEGLLPPNFW